MTMIPKIRFSEFVEEWKETTLADVAFINPHSEIPNVFEYVDLESVSGTQMLNHRTEKIESAPSRAQRLAKKGDIFYQTVRPYQKNNYYFDIDNSNKYVFSSGYAQIRTSINGKFLFSLLQSDFFVNQVLENCTGTSYPAIAPSALAKLNIKISPTLSEQRRISHFFTLLDETIRLEGVRLASLQQVKAASLQSFFPQEGEKEPRVRFKGFSGEWKKVRLGDVLTIKRGLTYSPTDIVNKGIRVLRSSNIDEDKFVISDSDVFVKRDCVNISFARKGDILITAANGSPRLVGKHAIVQDIDETPTVAGGFMLLATGEETEYVNACMGAEWYRKFLIYGVSGGNGAIGNLNKLELEEALMPYPTNKEERKKISTYFTNIGEQIRLLGEKIEMLKRVKGACLEGMMV